MKGDDNKAYNFGGQDYEVVIRLFNGQNDVYLTDTVWDDLVLEEDIFDWKIKGCITIKSPYDSLERESVESIIVSGANRKNLVYKFRNDGRDTLFISIKPTRSDMTGLPYTQEFPDKKWRLEIRSFRYWIQSRFRILLRKILQRSNHRS